MNWFQRFTAWLERVIGGAPAQPADQPTAAGGQTAPGQRPVIRFNVITMNLIAGAYLAGLVWLSMVTVPDNWYLNAWVALGIVALHLLTMHAVPVGHEGVITLAGSRASRLVGASLILREGTYIRLLFLFMRAINVDVRIRRARVTRETGTLGSTSSAQPEIKINPITDLTTDKVRAFAEMTWMFEVSDPDQFFSVEDPLTNSIAAVDGRTRDIIRALDADALAIISQEIFVRGQAGQAVEALRDGVLAPLNEDLVQWGLRIANDRFFLQGIRFTDEVEKDRERPYREIQQQAAEKIEFDRTKVRVDAIITQGVDSAEAWENEMSRQGKPLRDSVSIRTRADDPISDIVGRIIAGIRAARGERQTPHREEE